MKLKWEKEHKEEDGKRWIDYRADGKWWIAEGYDEPARKQENKPFSLLFRISTKPDKWNKVDVFHTVQDAKACAQELADEG